MDIRRICSRPALTLPANAPLYQAAALMRDRHVGAVIVVKAPIDRPIPVGIITDRDIVQAQLEHAANLSRLSAEQVMSRDPLVLNEELSVDDAIQRMGERGVRRAPVVSNNGTLVGLISVDDLLGEVAEEIIDLARLVTRQPKDEKSALSRFG